MNIMQSLKFQFPILIPKVIILLCVPKTNNRLNKKEVNDIHCIALSYVSYKVEAH